MNLENINYIYSVSNTSAYYISLSLGKSIENAINEMLYIDDVNTNNSTIKSVIDAWYQKYMINYTSYLEDTIFCNERSTSSLAGWSSSGNVTSSVHFKEYYSSNKLTCTNETDKFSLSNTKAKLTYPVGLLTNAEANLLKNNTAIGSTQPYWSGTPLYFSSFAAIRSFDENCVGKDTAVSYGLGVRPTISLKPKTKYISGDGSMENPYIVDTSSN